MDDRTKEKMWFDPLNKRATDDPERDFAHDPALIEQCVLYHRADLVLDRAELRSKIEELKKEPERIAMAALDKDQPQVWQRASGQVMAYNDVLSLLDPSTPQEKNDA